MFLDGIETLKFNNFGFVGKGEGMEYYSNPGLVEYPDIVGYLLLYKAEV